MKNYKSLLIEQIDDLNHTFMSMSSCDPRSTSVLHQIVEKQMKLILLLLDLLAKEEE